MAGGFRREGFRYVNLDDDVLVAFVSRSGFTVNALAFQADFGAGLGARGNLAEGMAGQGRNGYFASEYGCGVWDAKGDVDVISFALPVFLATDMDLQVDGLPIQLDAERLAFLDSGRNVDLKSVALSMFICEVEGFIGSGGGFVKGDGQVG